MDPFEEFEFKPLTDGLGFHKKKSSAANQKKESKTDAFANSNFNQGLELIDDPSLDPMRSPLPRKSSTGTVAPISSSTAIPTAPNTIANTTETDSSKAVDEILKTLQRNRRFEIDKNQQTTTKPKVETPKEELKASYWNFSAAILDAMLVVAASLLCMIILLVITKADLISNLKNPDADGMIYISTVALLGTVAFIYLSLNRIYLGWTPGEWAFDQQIGKNDQMKQPLYPVKVIARSLLVILTGFILFPLLSLIMKEDLAGTVTGARLFKKG